MSIKKAYNHWANSYDTNQNETRDLDQKVTKMVLDNYNYTAVLELGCGTGKNTRYHVSRETQIVGIDFSKEMLSKAKKKIQYEKIRFLQSDLTKRWKVPNTYFNLVTCSLTLEHISNLEHIFKEANQKLVAQGHFFICELHPFKQYLGSKARYESENGTVFLKTFTHHISEYLNKALNNGFQLVELQEWFDKDRSIDIPRLISFVFRKIL